MTYDLDYLTCVFLRPCRFVYSHCSNGDSVVPVRHPKLRTASGAMKVPSQNVPIPISSLVPTSDDKNNNNNSVGKDTFMLLRAPSKV